jgi:hypothetical protein
MRNKRKIYPLERTVVLVSPTEHSIADAGRRGREESQVLGARAIFGQMARDHTFSTLRAVKR